MIMQNIYTNIQFTSHYILNKDEQSTRCEKELTVQAQCLLKLLKKEGSGTYNLF